MSGNSSPHSHASSHSSHSSHHNTIQVALELHSKAHKTLGIRTVVVPISSTLPQTVFASCSISSFLSCSISNTGDVIPSSLHDTLTLHDLITRYRVNISNGPLQLTIELSPQLRECTCLGCDQLLLREASHRSCKQCQEHGHALSSSRIRTLSVPRLDDTFTFTDGGMSVVKQEAGIDKITNYHIMCAALRNISNEYWMFESSDPTSYYIVFAHDSALEQVYASINAIVESIAADMANEPKHMIPTSLQITAKQLQLKQLLLGPVSPTMTYTLKMKSHFWMVEISPIRDPAATANTPAGAAYPSGDPKPRSYKKLRKTIFKTTTLFQKIDNNNSNNNNNNNNTTNTANTNTKQSSKAAAAASSASQPQAPSTPRSVTGRTADSHTPATGSGSVSGSLSHSHSQTRLSSSSSSYPPSPSPYPDATSISSLIAHEEHTLSTMSPHDPHYEMHRQRHAYFVSLQQTEAQPQPPMDINQPQPQSNLPLQPAYAQPQWQPSISMSAYDASVPPTHPFPASASAGYSPYDMSVPSSAAGGNSMYAPAPVPAPAPAPAQSTRSVSAYDGLPTANKRTKAEPGTVPPTATSSSVPLPGAPYPFLHSYPDPNPNPSLSTPELYSHPLPPSHLLPGAPAPAPGPGPGPGPAPHAHAYAPPHNAVPDYVRATSVGPTMNGINPHAHMNGHSNAHSHSHHHPHPHQHQHQHHPNGHSSATSQNTTPTDQSSFSTPISPFDSHSSATSPYSHHSHHLHPRHPHLHPHPQARPQGPWTKSAPNPATSTPAYAQPQPPSQAHPQVHPGLGPGPVLPRDSAVLMSDANFSRMRSGQPVQAMFHAYQPQAHVDSASIHGHGMNGHSPADVYMNGAVNMNGVAHGHGHESSRSSSEDRSGSVTPSSRRSVSGNHTTGTGVGAGAISDDLVGMSSEEMDNLLHTKPVVRSPPAGGRHAGSGSHPHPHDALTPNSTDSTHSSTTVSPVPQSMATHSMPVILMYRDAALLEQDRKSGFAYGAAAASSTQVGATHGAVAVTGAGAGAGAGAAYAAQRGAESHMASRKRPWSPSGFLDSSDDGVGMGMNMDSSEYTRVIAHADAADPIPAPASQLKHRKRLADSDDFTPNAGFGAGGGGGMGAGAGFGSGSGSGSGSGRSSPDHISAEQRQRDLDSLSWLSSVMVQYQDKSRHPWFHLLLLLLGIAALVILVLYDRIIASSSDPETIQLNYALNAGDMAAIITSIRIMSPAFNSWIPNNYTTEQLSDPETIDYLASQCHASVAASQAMSSWMFTTTAFQQETGIFAGSNNGVVPPPTDPPTTTAVPPTAAAPTARTTSAADRDKDRKDDKKDGPGPGSADWWAVHLPPGTSKKNQEKLARVFNNQELAKSATKTCRALDNRPGRAWYTQSLCAYNSSTAFLTWYGNVSCTVAGAAAFNVTQCANFLRAIESLDKTTSVFWQAQTLSQAQDNNTSVEALVSASQLKTNAQATSVACAMFQLSARLARNDATQTATVYRINPVYLAILQIGSVGIIFLFLFICVALSTAGRRVTQNCTHKEPTTSTSASTSASASLPATSSRATAAAPQHWAIPHRLDVSSVEMTNNPVHGASGAELYQATIAKPKSSSSSSPAAAPRFVVARVTPTPTPPSTPLSPTVFPHFHSSAER